MAATKNPYHTTKEVYIPEMYMEGQDRQRCLLPIEVSLIFMELYHTLQIIRIELQFAAKLSRLNVIFI